MNFKSDLLKLPLNSQEKLFLWLLSSNLKPGTDLLIHKWNNDYQKNLKSVNKFLKTYGYFFTSKSHWQHFHPLNKMKPKFVGRFYYVSNKENLLEMVKKRETKSKNRQLLAGNFYGFPKKAVEAYSAGGELMLAKDEYAMLNKEYWYPYLTYAIRKDHELEDAELAKKWCDETRKNFPELAKLFENEHKEIYFEPPIVRKSRESEIK